MEEQIRKQVMKADALIEALNDKTIK